MAAKFDFDILTSDTKNNYGASDFLADDLKMNMMPLIIVLRKNFLTIYVKTVLQ